MPFLRIILVTSSYFAWDEQHIWDTYMMLNRIEAAFRSLKHELSYRPIYHSTEKRAEAHIFIAVLAYLILSVSNYARIA